MTTTALPHGRLLLTRATTALVRQRPQFPRIDTRAIICNDNNKSLASTTRRFFASDTDATSAKAFSTLSIIEEDREEDETTAVAAEPQEETTRKRSPKKRKWVRKPPLTLTPRAQSFFSSLLQSTNNNKNDVETKHIQLQYHQSTTGEPRMVFAFDFVLEKDITPRHETVSLKDNNAQPYLVVHPNALLKVLGCTLDLDEDNVLKPVLYDKEGNLLDPNV